MELQKINIRVNRDGVEAFQHFCYVPPEIKEKFDKLVNTKRNTANYWASKWAKEDFEMESLSTWDDLEELRNKIKDTYRALYPELYIDSVIDNQGWVRTWYTKHMEKELWNIGE